MRRALQSVLLGSTRQRSFAVPTSNSTRLCSSRGAKDWYERMWALTGKKEGAIDATKVAQDIIGENNGDAIAAARIMLTAEPSIGGGGGATSISAMMSSSATVPDELCRNLWEIYHHSSTLSNKDEASKFRLDFFALLTEMGIDRSAVIKKHELLSTLLERLKGSNDENVVKDGQIRKAVHALSDISTPLFVKWLQRSASLPHGVKWLIDMRHDVLELIAGLVKAEKALSSNVDSPQQPTAEHARQRAVCSLVDQELTRLLKDWFDRSWLVIQQLSWGDTPPAVLEQVVLHEAVHPFHSLMDVKPRLQPTKDRHIFAFFHPAVVREPLVMVQVALVKGISRSVDTILSRPTPVPPQPQEQPDTAIFYSINSAQKGLKGIDLGNALIKAVVEELRHVAPHVKTFSTLSPIPGFAAWLKVQDAQLRQGKSDVCIFGSPDDDEEELRMMKKVADALLKGGSDTWSADDTSAENRSKVTSLMLRHMTGPSDWCFNLQLTDALKEPIMRSVAYYLCRQKRRSRILDPVGNFHVGNGAAIHQLNWLANCSARGSSQSYTVMVNYLYTPSDIATNARQYVLSHDVVVGDDVSQWLK